MARWRAWAFLCRYAHQDIYRLIGRDPMQRPLTALEVAVFRRCIADLWNDEVKEAPTPSED